MRKILYIAVIIICLCSCSDNSFYVDIQNQSLIRCNGQSMRTVSIYLSEKVLNETSLEPIDGKDYYLIKYIGSGTGEDNTIYLMKPNENYEVLFNDRPAPNGIILLKSNTQYNIVHRSNGDATPFSILIETDENGKIRKASKTDC